MNETPSPAAPATPPPPRRFHQSGLVQLFLIPLAVCLAALGIFLLFARISFADRPVEKLVVEIQNGTGNNRWEAANELSRRVNRDPSILKDPKVVDALLSAWKDAKEDNPRMKQVLTSMLGASLARQLGPNERIQDYFTMTLGKSGDPRVVQVLIEALHSGDEKTGPQTKIYALIALGNSGSPEALAPLLNAAGDSDAGVRTAAAYGLGSLGPAGGDAAKEKLHTLLGDESLDVRWNGALGLARLGDNGGESILMQMTDRAALDALRVRKHSFDPRDQRAGPEQDYPLAEPQKRDAMINGLKGLARIHSPALAARLQTVIDADPDYEVREAAQKIQQALAAEPSSAAAHAPPLT